MSLSIFDHVSYKGSIYYKIHRTNYCKMYIFETHCLLLPYNCKNQNVDNSLAVCQDTLHSSFQRNTDEIIITLHDSKKMICGQITWDIYSAIFQENINCSNEQKLCENIYKLLDKDIIFRVIEIMICTEICQQKKNHSKKVSILFFGILIGDTVYQKRMGHYKCQNQNKNIILIELMKKYEDTKYDLSKAIVTTIEPSNEIISKCSLL